MKKSNISKLYYFLKSKFWKLFAEDFAEHPVSNKTSFRIKLF